MKILIIGGCGFIGSNIAYKLLTEHEVDIIDDLSTRREANIKDFDIEFVKGSVTDMYILKKSFKDVDYIFHQAALPSVQRSIEDPIKANEVNVGGTLNVLVAAKDAGVKKMIYASSSSVYGDTPELPKREDMKPDSKSPYTVAKLTGDYYCRIFNDIYSLKTVCLRYFNVYVPKQDPSSDYAAVIPKFIKCILDGESPVIYGDGGQTRDFTFVYDVVQANMLAMETDATGMFNVAMGQWISVNDLANMIMEITGNYVDCVHDELRAGDVRDSRGDISKVSTDFWYTPRYGIKQGLLETIEWFGRSG